MVRLVANAKKSNVLAAYLSLCSDRKNISPMELTLFREVLAHGSTEEQVAAVDALAFIYRGTVRRALIDVLNDTAALLEVRERATEMLHLHESKETAEACARALDDRNASIRFWAAYTLGQITAFRKGHREIAASALGRVLDDEEVAPGWWSVGREAQAMIVGLRDDPGAKERLQAQIRRVQQDPNASAEDRRWAEFYQDERE
jgi:HEAT repeat protein